MSQPPQPLPYVGKGCCRLCGQKRYGKQTCTTCRYKYCYECGPQVWKPGSCTHYACINCKREEILVAFSKTPPSKAIPPVSKINPIVSTSPSSATTSEAPAATCTSKSFPAAAASTLPPTAASGISQSAIAATAAPSAPAALPFKGCCAMCLNYAMSKKPCLSCGRKYCNSCTSSCLSQPQDKCVKCSPGLTVVAMAPQATPGVTGKGCCAMCSRYSMGKRACLGCGQKFCASCQVSVMGKDTCMKCDPSGAIKSRLILNGACASCRTSHGLDSLRCVVCGKRYCQACEQHSLGVLKPEGMKCAETCMGQLPHQVLMPQAAVFASKRLQWSNVVINGQALDLVQAWVLLCEPNNVCMLLQAGEWWYDARSGWLGKMGKGPKAVIRSGLSVGGSSMDPQCTGGDTGIYFNGRQINQNERSKFSMAGVQLAPGEWFFENNGDYGPNFGPDAGQVEGNFWKQGGKRLAIALGLVFVGFVGADLLLGAEEGLLTDAGGVSTGSEGVSYSDSGWSNASTGQTVTYSDSGMVGSDGQGGVFYCGKDSSFYSS